MGFFNTLLGIETQAEKREKLKKETEEHAAECQCAANSSLGFGSLFAALHASPMTIAAFFRCVDLITNTVAQLPVRVKVKGSEKSELEEHAIIAALTDRNNELTQFQLMKNLVRDVIIKGNAFVHIERANDGTVKRLRYIESQKVTINWNSKTRVLFYQVPEYFGNIKIEPVNMLHFRLWTWDGVNGVGIVKYMTNTLDVAKKTDDAMLNYFKKDMNLNGVLSAKNMVSTKQIEQIKQAWNTTYSDGGGGLIVLPNNLEYQPIQSNFSEAQNQSREWNATEICTWLGVSPILIGILTHSSGYSFEQARLEFLSNTIMTWVRMFEDEMNRKMLKPSESDLYIDIDETTMLRADKKTLVVYYTGLIKAGILTINEARTALGYSQVEDGDKLFVPYTDIAQNTIGGNTEQTLNLDNQ